MRRFKMPIHGNMRPALLTAIAAALALSTPCPAESSVDDQDIHYLKHLSIENLLATEVTSVSKKTETVANAAAAVFVITREDIVRSGSRTIPDLLRMVPGINVAAINANSWAVTARGFSGRFSNKLLVMIDGRTVYSPTFSGTYWDVQDTLLEDIERIEVVRGPGATIWGANAVNGVINIITRHAKQTQGVFASIAAGNELQAEGALRYGGKAGTRGTYRVFGKYSARDDSVDRSGNEGHDAWEVFRGGFRSDFDLNARDSLKLLGDIYSGDSGQDMSIPAVTPPDFPSDVKMSGGNLLAGWERQLTEGNLSLQAYVDHTRRRDAYVKESRNTVDVDVTYRTRLSNTQELTAGGAYRWTGDRTSPGRTSELIPANSDANIFSLFAQDDISLFDGTTHLIIGSKFEHNDYTGYEIQPSARLSWSPTREQTAWLAVSRAVRTPSRSDRDVRATLYSITGTAVIPPGIPVPTETNITAMGNKAFKSEELLAYEVGYRAQPRDWFSYDLTAFYNDYDNLRSSTVGTPTTVISAEGIVTTIPITISNDIHGETFGAEAVCNMRLTDWWRLMAGYSWLKMNISTSRSPFTGESLVEYTDSPEHQVSLRSHIDLPHNIEVNPALYYVSRNEQRSTPSYFRLDLHVSWKPTDSLELSIAGASLLDGQNPEFGRDLGLQGMQVERSIYAQVKYSF